MRRLLLLSLLLFPSSALAQTQVCTPAPPFPTPPPTSFTCYATLPFKVAFDVSPPLAGDVYRVRLNGTQVGPDINAVVGTTAIQVTLQGVAVGTTTITAGHLRPTLPEVLSAPITLMTIIAPLPPPTSPTSLRIIAELLDDHGRVLARYLLLGQAPLLQ